MSGAAIPVPNPLSGPAVLARLLPVDGVGSGLDADLVRGRALPSGLFRFDLAPAFTAPPTFAETTAQSLFGV